MKNLTYNSLNCFFTYENVCLQLKGFWRKEMINFRGFNHARVWLTITVIDRNNNSFTLINNLPFNTNDYKDVLSTIWDNYKNYFVISSENRLKSINFSYYVEDKKNNQYKVNFQNIYMFLYKLFLVTIFLIIICILLLYMLDYYNYDILLIKRDILNIDEDIRSEPYIYSSNIYYAKTNGFCIFTPFIDLFNKSGTTSYNYFPSYFVPTYFNIPTLHISSIDIIVNDQYKILYNNADDLHKLFLDLAHILHEYKEIVRYIVI